MTTYGDLPGVKIVEQAGGFTDIQIGRNQYLTIVGIGDDDATEEEDELIEYIDHSEGSSIGSDTLELDTVGEDGSLASAISDASASGVETRYLRAVMAETADSEEILSDASGELDAEYIVPSTDSIHAEDETTSDELDVHFRYESPPDPPESDDAIHINPHTVEYEFDTDVDSVDIEFEEVYWEDALSTAVNAHSEGDFGVVVALTADESAASHLAELAESAREQRFAMVLGMAGAEPNDTMDDTYPYISATEFEHSLDSDVGFLFGPTTDEDETPASRNFGTGLLGPLAGKIASRPITDPIYTDTVGGATGLRQQLSRGEVDLLREERIIPVKYDGGLVMLEDNQSTFDWDMATEWERDLFRRQAVDMVIATAYQIGRSQIGNILDADTVSDTQELLVDQLGDFVEQGFLRSGGQQVAVERDGVNTMSIEMRVTPLGVTKNVEISLTIER